MLTGPGGMALGFGTLDDHEAPGWPNEHGSKQFHLDLAVDDLDAGRRRVRRAGRDASRTSSPVRPGGCCSTPAATRSASPRPRTGADGTSRTCGLCRPRDDPRVPTGTRAAPDGSDGRATARAADPPARMSPWRVSSWGSRRSSPSSASVPSSRTSASSTFGAEVLSHIAFFVASPALLLTTVAEADTHDVLSRSLVATVVGVVVPATVYVVVAWWRWRRSAGERVIGALASSYVNAGNLGLPVAAYVLGDAALVAPDPAAAAARAPAAGPRGARRRRARPPPDDAARCCCARSPTR